MFFLLFFLMFYLLNVNLTKVFLGLIFTGISFNYKVSNPFSLVLLLFLGRFFVTLLLTRGVVYNYVLGIDMLILFSFSFSVWFASFIGGFIVLIRYWNANLLTVIGLYLFDIFVVLLRPVTLTLRVLINVSLGHYLIMIMRNSSWFFLFLVWGFESFVYVVQSYVFMTLSKSYLEILS